MHEWEHVHLSLKPVCSVEIDYFRRSSLNLAAETIEEFP